MGEAVGAANAPAAGSYLQDGAHLCTQGRGLLAVLRSCPLEVSPQQGDPGWGEDNRLRPAHFEDETESRDSGQGCARKSHAPRPCFLHPGHNPDRLRSQTS